MTGLFLSLQHIFSTVHGWYSRLRNYLVYGCKFYIAINTADCRIRREILDLYSNRYLLDSEKAFVETTMIDICKEEMMGLDCDIDPCILTVHGVKKGYRIHISGHGCRHQLDVVLYSAYRD